PATAVLRSVRFPLRGASRELPDPRPVCPQQGGRRPLPEREIEAADEHEPRPPPRPVSRVARIAANFGDAPRGDAHESSLVEEERPGALLLVPRHKVIESR